MLLLVSYLFMLLAILGIVIVVIRKIPVLTKLPAEPAEGEEKSSLKPQNGAASLLKGVAARPHHWLMFFGWTEKALRKTRLLFLKIDSFFVSLIAKSRNKSQELAVKSREWVSEKRMKKIEKLKLVAKLKMTPEQKEEHLLRSLRQNPKDIKAYRELGLLYLERNNFQDAEAAFEEVLKLNPEDEAAKMKLDEIKTLLRKNFVSDGSAAEIKNKDAGAVANEMKDGGSPA
jgi:tetratricopeptide (TPR) repeat protein